MIYMAYNTVNGKYYIGKTNDLRKRRTLHKSRSYHDPRPFYQAIREYGFDTFAWFILSNENTAQREGQIIRALKARDLRCGYNTYNSWHSGPAITDAQACKAAARAYAGTL